MENQDSPEKKWAKAMLELDLAMQSGAIWTEEKSRMQKEQKADPEDENPFPVNESYDDGIYYELSDGTRIYMDTDNPMILDGEPTIYGDRIIPNTIHFLK